MDPTEYLLNNRELRSCSRYFQHRVDAVGVEWDVAEGTAVAAGQPLGRIVFGSGPDYVIRSPVAAVFMRGNDGVDPARLPSRPSLLLALFKPIAPAGGLLLESAVKLRIDELGDAIDVSDRTDWEQLADD